MGVPLLYALLLYKGRTAIQKRTAEHKLKTAISFLWKDYKPDYFWWEVLDILRRRVDFFWGKIFKFGTFFMYSLGLKVQVSQF